MKIEENHNHYFYEQMALNQGFKNIAGGDEAGRGPWAGPVYAAFVILSPEEKIHGLDDSKKLSRKKRKDLYEEIKARAYCYGVGTASAEEIDKFNILEATRLAFSRAFNNLSVQPDYVLLDFIKLPWLNLPHRAFAKGESISASVAAASILAKEARDIFMEDAGARFPGYGFEKHMGYGTKIHQEALIEKGICPLHRKTFKPIKKFLPTDLRNETLF